MKKRLVLKKMVIATLNDKEKEKVVGGAKTRDCRTMKVTICETHCGHICQ